MSFYKNFIYCSILMLRDSGILQRLLETQWSVQLRGVHVRMLINFADYHLTGSSIYLSPITDKNIVEIS